MLFILLHCAKNNFLTQNFAFIIQNECKLDVLIYKRNHYLQITLFMIIHY